MTFKEGLINARSHIVFVLGLIAAFGLVYKIDTMDLKPGVKDSAIASRVEITLSEDIPKPSRGDLSEQEKRWAQVAWRYFENNFHPETGLTNSVDNYPASTMWDTASYLMAIISAYRLDVIEQKEFDEKLSAALKTLAKLPLFDGQLPNKSYNTITLAMVNYQNQVTERGIGWSAIDIGRILVPLNIITWNYPQYTPDVKAVIEHWQLQRALKNGELYSAIVDQKTGKTRYLQEGRLGYEEYSAKSYNLLGLDVSKAIDYKDYLSFIDIYGIQIPVDRRDPEVFHAHNYVVSESYILDGLEFGWDYLSREFAYRVYSVQQERFNATGQVTAVSEDNIDQAPYFVYNTIYTDGKAWNAITEDGADASKYKTISTKAALGWSVLFQSPYRKHLIDAVKELYDPDKGWYSGIYEQSKKPNKAITANTNAIILEALCFKKFGPLVALYPTDITATESGEKK